MSTLAFSWPGRRQDSAAQQGQVMVLGMLLAGAAVLALVRYFDTGMVVAEKARQDHVLDAVAYSGALAQARSLNMLAYIQRAQAAHQVAMAHLVTLGSLAHFAGTEATRASMGNPPAYVIGMHFGAEHAAAYLSALAATGLEYSASQQGPLARAYAEHDRVARSVLASAASQVVAGMESVRDQAMREVLESNYPGENGHLLRVIHDGSRGFLASRAGDPGLRPFMLELAGLYDFLDPRDHTRRSLFPVSARCPHLRHELRRRGSTVLGAGGIWQSIDTQSYHALRSNKWVGCYYREYPMGWGWIPPGAGELFNVDYVENPPEDFSAQDFWRWVRESTRWDLLGAHANPLANSWAYVSRQQWPGGGLPVFHDVAVPGRPAARFTLSLQREGRGGLTYTSHSGAEAYFRRPQARADGKRELANAFHPYWQARLRQPEAGMGAP